MLLATAVEPKRGFGLTARAKNKYVPAHRVPPGQGGDERGP